MSRIAPQPQTQMTLRQALVLAGLLVEWELENPIVVPAPVAWQSELLAARRILSEFSQRLEHDDAPAPLDPPRPLADGGEWG